MGPLVLVLHPGSAGLTAQVHDNHHPGLHQQTALSSCGGGIAFTIKAGVQVTCTGVL